MAQSIKKNFLYSCILTTSGYIFPLLTYPYVSRVLGVEHLGTTNFVTNIVGYFVIISMLGMNVIGTREIAASTNEDRNGNVDVTSQIEFIKNNPIFVIRIFTNNIVEKGFVWLNNFSYDGILEGVSNSTGLLLIIPAILEKNKNEKLGKSKIFKWLSFFIFTTILIADLGMMYLSFSQVGSGNIEGFQNRYLISPMILLLIPFSNLFKIKNEIKDYEKKLVFIILIMNIDLILGEIVKAFSTYRF